MPVLAIDTATPRSSVAVVSGERSLELHSTQNPGESVVGLIDEVLHSADVARDELSGVVVGVGPGPYTSTRVGVMIANGIARALEIPIVGICSLDAIAAAAIAGKPAPLGVATDARRREIYWAIYEPAEAEFVGVRRTHGPAVNKPAEMLEQIGIRVWAGQGFGRYPELALAAEITELDPQFPDATWLARIAKAAQDRGEVERERGPLARHGGDGAGTVPAGSTLLTPNPLYLRRPDAQVPPIGGRQCVTR